ncbi:hypothetical protein HDU96_002385 [Phlyctochytrium bullatum]|nr:hypothetical protein HDU96_002385 [Phlyctochytrium bullatum]
MSDLPWHPNVVARFRQASIVGTEKEYYPCYSALLSTIFRVEDGFIVCPVTYPLQTNESVDFVLEYQVEMMGKPVLIVELKPHRSLDDDSARAAADVQIRTRFNSLLRQCPLNVMKGISAFGTSVCVYEASKTTRTVTPPRIAAHEELLSDTAPRERWNMEVLHRDGAQQLWQMLVQLREECYALHAQQ